MFSAMEIASTLGVPVAWQTNSYLGREGKGAGCGGGFGATSACDNQSFLRMLEAGITPKGGSGANAKGLFIEVFPPMRSLMATRSSKHINNWRSSLSTAATRRRSSCRTAARSNSMLQRVS
jgi:hypothetical protein